MGFNMLFYIIFGSNLLTGGPAQIAVFFAYFSVSQKKNIKRSPTGGPAQMVTVLRKANFSLQQRNKFYLTIMVVKTSLRRFLQLKPN